MVRAGSIGHSGQLPESLSVAAADHRADARETASLSGICRECGASGLVLANLPHLLCVPAAERRTAGAHLHCGGVTEYRSDDGAVQVPVDAPGVGVLGVAGDWNNRDAVGTVADYSTAAQRGHRAQHAGCGSSDCSIPLPLLRHAFVRAVVA